MHVRVDLVLRYRYSSLKPPDLKVGVGSVGSDGNAGPHLISLGSLRLGKRRAPSSPQATRKVDFPACASSDAERLLRAAVVGERAGHGSEEHTSELQSLMRI